MKDYSRGKVYTIRCLTDDSLIYVGSTIEHLCERFASHKRSSKLERYKDRLVYTTINGDWNNWKIELHQLYPCSCVEELRAKEGEIIREIGTLNMKVAGRTHKEYYENNKDEIKEYNNKYQKKYKDKYKEKLTCECGCIVNRNSFSNHKKSKKHCDLMAVKQLSQPVQVQDDQQVQQV